MNKSKRTKQGVRDLNALYPSKPARLMEDIPEEAVANKVKLPCKPNCPHCDHYDHYDRYYRG